MAPIGSFDEAWEDYNRDAATTPALIEEAKNPVKSGGNAPNWRLRIGTEEYTNRMVSAEVTFSSEGDSSIRFVVAGNLRALQYERARVELWFGYGTKLVPYFRGRLADPVDMASGLHSEATAYGLGTQLGNRYAQGRIDYGGWDLRDAWWDLIDRFGAEPDRFDFWGEHSTTLANDISEFGLEGSLREIEETILEPMQFKSFDHPGGMRIVKRSHLSTLGTENVFSGAGHYNVQHYPKDGFTFDQSMQNFYADVVIFRRTNEYAGGGGEGGSGTPDDNEYAVYATEPVADPGPFHVHEGRDYVVADYPGGQEHAEREAELLATALGRGVGRFEWRCFPIDFAPGNHFTVTRNELIHDATYFGVNHWFALPQIDAVDYACVAEEVVLRIGAAGEGERWSMTVSGTAFEESRTTVREAGTPIEIDLGVPPFDPTDPDPGGGGEPGTDYAVVVGSDTVVVDGDQVVDTP